MKIAMIGQKGIPTLFGGVERHVEEISKRLAKEKTCHVYVYARSYYTSKKIKKYKKVNIVHLPSIKTKHIDAISHTFLSTCHAIFFLRPHIIHYHGIGPAICIFLAKIFIPSAKIIFTFHCRDYYHKKWGRAARFSLLLGEKIGCRLADEIIAVSPEIQKYVKRRYNKKAVFIPNGVNREKHFSAHLIKKWELKKNNYILAVTRLVRHKGIHYLINAFKKIETDKKLVIVGPSFHTEDYEAYLKNLARNDSRIIFLGLRKGQVLNELYSNAAIFVHPSEEEGLPLGVLEAASFGRTLLLSDIIVHQKMLMDLPFFFKNKSVQDLKEKLDLLLKNQIMLDKRSREIKQYCIRNYSWDKIVERITLKYA